MELLIVAEPEDRLARELAQLAKSRGTEIHVCGVRDASRLFTIEAENTDIGISPTPAMFLRALSGPMIREGFDDAFLHGEAMAALWAVAVLTPAPVLNRPSPVGFSGLVASSTVVVEQRLGHPPSSREVFCDQFPGPPQRFDPAKEWWCVQDIHTQQTTLWPHRASAGPYRARQIRADPIYEIVGVVNQKAWRISSAPIEHLALEAESVQIMSAMQLGFGSVIWSLAGDYSAASLVKVEPFPTFDFLRLIWDSLGPTLLDALVS